VITTIADIIENIITENKIDRERIIGIGIGASGLVDYQNGVNLLAPNLKWNNIPIRKIIQSKLNFPVIVDNNVRAMALGEAFFGIGRKVDSLAFVYGRTGVGAGFIVGGRVFRGSNTGAGEIGHTIMVPKDGKLCRCGQRGCLETLVSEPTLISEAQAVAEQYPGGLLANHLQRNGTEKTIERILLAAQEGDIPTKEMIEQKACYLGIALANLVNIMNPELILLGGMFAQAQDIFLPIATKTMREMAFAALGEKVRVQPTSFGWRAGVIGASALALTRFFYQAASPDHQLQI
jgi:predicted NBD/HSP70 family sugar kinase